MSDTPVSHAIVLPDENFFDWLAVLRPYRQHFENVVVVRSPRGNDLNRYRNVTAVATPRTWYKDDPLLHIRRIYPSVVRVDVIQATAPAHLAAELNYRIQDDDRFGEMRNNPPHIFDRFILEWATTHRPMRITRRFRDKPGEPDDHIGMDVLTEAGADVIAAAPGTVTRIWTSDHPDAVDLGRYVQVTTKHYDLTYIVTYGHMKLIDVAVGRQVKSGDVLGTAAGDAITVAVQQPPHGMTNFRLPNLVDPMRLVYVEGLRVRPVDTGLRVRKLPNSSGEIITRIHPWNRVEPRESQGVTLSKVGVPGEWLRLRTPDGRDGYSAAWFLETYIAGMDRLFDGANPVGVNLDLRHPLGAPDPARLGGLGWLRIPYNVSNGVGSQDINAAYDRYAPQLERYARAGYKIMLTLTHQTYGEGMMEWWPWSDMTDEKWQQFTAYFSEFAGRIADQFNGSGLVHCWQIWNEQDAPMGAVASVPMRPVNYAMMLTRTLQSIRAVDSTVAVITGGHTGGPETGATFASSVIDMLPSTIRPDGIAFHPYGRGPHPDINFAQFGHIDESIYAYSRIMPDKPIWITEWGVLDQPQAHPNDVANYAMNFISFIKARYTGHVAALIWYAWAEGMHNGYGLVDRQGNPRIPLTERYLQA